MAKAYIGADNVSKLVKKMYMGVDGVARKITKAYAGVNGVAKLVYSEATKKEYLYGGTSTFVHTAGDLVETYEADYTLATDSFTLQIEKYDTVPLYVYFDGALISTLDTEGEHTINIDGGASRLATNGTIAVTIASESTYGLGEQAFYQFWEYGGTDSKNNSNTTLYCRMTSATLSDNVIKIWNHTFRTMVSENYVLSIPSRGLITIGDDAFNAISALIGLQLPYTFCLDGDFVIPDTVTSIGSDAFYASNITSVSIPNSVTSIGNGAFYSCYMTSVTIPSSVTSIGTTAFYSESMASIFVEEGNPRYESVDGVLFDKINAELVSYPQAKEGESYSVPDGTISIGEYAIHYCNKLLSITIPSSVTSIKRRAVIDCEKLANITFKHGVSDPLSIHIDTETASNSAFYVSPELATTVYHNGNESVLNYDWATCERTVTFIQE